MRACARTQTSPSLSSRAVLQGQARRVPGGLVGITKLMLFPGGLVGITKQIGFPGGLVGITKLMLLPGGLVRITKLSFWLGFWPLTRSSLLSCWN